ncbi:MAG: NFACT family protein, partial [Eubacterium sp.]|nr:NFACT family protein [Eubacterium sp.]
MAFDGVTVAAITDELQTKLAGGSIQKIAQPETDELILTIKNNRVTYRLLLSASASLPLIHLTEQSKMSPLTAPNFCMVLRKHLSSARILSISQPSLERIVEIQVEHLNELGDLVRLKLIVELMGKYSNIILVDSDDTIIDSIKHVNGMISSVREVLPGKTYFVPNTTNKTNPFDVTVDDWNQVILTKPTKVAKSIYSSLTGLSAVMSQELAYRAGIDGDADTASLNGNQRSSLMDQYRGFIHDLKQNRFHPVIYFENGFPKEFSATPLTIYDSLMHKEYDSISEVIETFYREKAVVSRIRQKSADLRKHVTMLIERCSKKISIQTKQLNDTEKKDKYKVYGELINTYGYQLAPGSDKLTCLNYYTNEEITIPLDITLSPTENANKYFDKYNKMKRTYEAVSV